jgi:hypothetical protein
MYMRTGSVVRPNSLSSVASAAAASSVSSSSALTRGLHQQQRIGVRGHLVNGDPHVVDHADDVFDLLRIDDALGQVIVDLVVSQVSLIFPLRDQ